MCDHCGCGSDPAHDHEHAHDHEDGQRSISVRESVLSFNDRLAERNRGFFQAKGIFVVNLLSSPGSGKTTLIERTLADRGGDALRVIVGDLQTDNDADRIRAKGGQAVQVTTGEVCHLDAHMLQHAMDDLNWDGCNTLLIENVGNLVCPASFDLGEAARVVVISVTEGEDKPLKYPVMFQRADLVIVNKLDLAEAVGFDRDAALANIQRVAPQAQILEVSARTGDGMSAWYDWLASNGSSR